MPVIGGTPTPQLNLPEIGFATATFYTPDGTAWPLTDPPRGWFTISEGVSGLDAAPYELTTDDHPRGGARLRHAQPVGRTILWPLHVYGDTHIEFVGRWRALASAIIATLRNGPGQLEIARPDGSRRRIGVLYSSGFEGQGKQGTGIRSDTAVLTFFCEDPYWRDPVPIIMHREQAAGEDFFQPYPSVSSSQVLGAARLTNPGDVTAWPEWTISGPASLVTFTHTDTGEEFVLDPNAPAIGHGNLLASEQVTVTTDPPRVRFENGGNWIGALNWPGAALWGLRPGENNVTFALASAGPGSAVEASFTARYETA